MKKIVVVLALIALAAGCASTYRYRYDVNVDSIASKNTVSNKRYILAPGMEVAQITDLEFVEYAALVHRALSKKGYVRTDKIQDAGVVIFLAYGISDSFTPPKIALAPNWNSADIFQSSFDVARETDDSASARRSITTDLPRDETGVGGLLAGNLSSAVYTRIIILDAFYFDVYRDSRKEVRAWQTKVVSTGKTDDLRLLFPIMLAGALDYIGDNTRGKIEQWIYEDDINLLYMMGR